MAYADQQMSSRRIIAIAMVALFHALVGYAFITGLAFNVIKKTVADLKTFDVQDQPPPPPAPPPPPPPEQKVEPPPVVAPPPIVQTQQTIAPPIIQSVPVAPPVAIHVDAPPAPPPPPKPSVAKGATARGNSSDWVTSDDYPSRALREEKEGSVGISFDIGADGRVSNCQVNRSSGTPELDSATCPAFTRRARYNPAQDSAGNKIAQTGMSQGIRWQIPKE